MLVGPNSADGGVELVIVGGGPAGLSAALVAARARRTVLLVDGGEARNRVAEAMHGFITRDGVPPAEFRALARVQLAAYPTVTVVDDDVTAISGERGAFTVIRRDGGSCHAAVVLMATGLVDVLPDLPGLREHWGNGVYHCPYCDGYEHRDRIWGVIADEPTVYDYARFLRGWTASVVMFTMGGEPTGEALARLDRAGVIIETGQIENIVGGPGASLEAVEMRDGRRVPIESLWIRPARRQHRLTVALGLAINDEGAVCRDVHGATSVPGIYTAGDLAEGATQQVLQAAADGARVAMSINHWLIVEADDVDARVTAPTTGG
ncbi:MAG: NAD(P)/FAD-dependent oxidoreductase [Acidobacteriota bacterium]